MTRKGSFRTWYQFPPSPTSPFSHSVWLLPLCTWRCPLIACLLLLSLEQSLPVSALCLANTFFSLSQHLHMTSRWYGLDPTSLIRHLLPTPLEPISPIGTTNPTPSPQGSLWRCYLSAVFTSAVSVPGPHPLDLKLASQITGAPWKFSEWREVRYLKEGLNPALSQKWLARYFLGSYTWAHLATKNAKIMETECANY